MVETNFHFSVFFFEFEPLFIDHQIPFISISRKIINWFIFIVGFWVLYLNLQTIIINGGEGHLVKVLFVDVDNTKKFFCGISQWAKIWEKYNLGWLFDTISFILFFHFFLDFSPLLVGTKNWNNFAYWTIFADFVNCASSTRDTFASRWILNDDDKW